MSKTTPKRPSAPEPAQRFRLQDAEAVFGLTAATARDRYARLSPRERQVAELIAAGKSTREIAAELGITVYTMDVHQTNIKNKLDASSSVHVANVVHLLRLAELAEPVEP